MSTTRQCRTAQLRFNHRALQTSLPQTYFCGTGSRRSAPASPAELRALLTRVYHRTWAGNREMLEKIGNAWVRTFLKVDPETSHRAAQNAQRKNVINTQLTLHGTLHMETPYCFVTHPKPKILGPPEPGSPKTLMSSPEAHYFV